VRKKRPNGKNTGDRWFIMDFLLPGSLAGGWNLSRPRLTDILNRLGMGKKD
jgi:hypothetical protein